MKQGKFHRDKEREIRVSDEKEREMNPVVARGGWLIVVEKWREDEHERFFFFLEKQRGFGERERECVCVFQLSMVKLWVSRFSKYLQKCH